MRAISPRAFDEPGLAQAFTSSVTRFRMFGWAESLAEFRFGDAEVRILPPQPASPSLTHTEIGSRDVS
jgi:hypothetical protein